MNSLLVLAALMAPSPPVLNAAESTTIGTQFCDDPALQEFVSGWCPSTASNGGVTAWDTFARLEFDLSRASDDGSTGYVYLRQTETSGVCPAAPAVSEILETDSETREDDGYAVFPVDSLARQFQVVRDLTPNTEYCAYVYHRWEWNDSNVLEVGPFSTQETIVADTNLQPFLRGNSALGIPPGCMGHANDFWCTPITHLEKSPDSDRIINAWGLFEDCGGGDPQVCNEPSNQVGTPGSSELNSIKLDYGSVNPSSYVTYFGQSVNIFDENTPTYNLVERTPENGFTDLVDTTEYYVPHSDDLNIPIGDDFIVQARDGLECDDNIATNNGEAIEDGPDADCHLNAYNPDTGELRVVWRAKGLSGPIKSGGTQAVWDFSAKQPAELRGLNCSSTNAGGVPYASLLVTPGEIVADAPIRHMLALTAPNSWIEGNYVKWDGMHAAGGGTHTSRSAQVENYTPPGWDDAQHRRMPYGTVTRYIGPIPASLTPAEKKILVAWRDYGAILMDGTFGQPFIAMTNDALDQYSWVDTEVGLNHSLTFEFTIDFEWDTDMVEVVSDLSDVVPLGLCDREPIVEIPPITETQCSDGIDNDNDGLIDLADSGCTDADDDDEFNAPLGSVAACGDGFDNDGDGLTDLDDIGGCTSLADTSEEDGPPAPQQCTVALNGSVASEFSSAMGPAINNMTWNHPTFITALNLENNEKYLNGFIDLSLLDGYEEGGVTYVADPTGAQESTALNFALREGASHDLGVWVPDGTYAVNRTVEIISWAQGGPINNNCDSGASPDTAVLRGESKDGTIIKLGDNPDFDFDNPNNKREFVLWYRNRGDNCEGTTAGPDVQTNPGTVMEINGREVRVHDANGFDGMVANLSIDINGHVGAIGLHLAAAQSTIAEDVHVFSSTGTRVGTAFGQLGVRTAAGRNLSADNVDLALDWTLSDASPGVFGMTVKNVNTLVQTDDRTPAYVVGLYMEHDLSRGSIVQEVNGGFGGGAGVLEIVDSVIYLTGSDANNDLFKWDQFNKSFGLRDVAIYGLPVGHSLMNLPGTADDVVSLGSEWQYIREAYKSQPGPKGTYNANTGRYNSFPGLNSIEGETPVVGAFDIIGHEVMDSAPVNLWERHWNMFPLDPFGDNVYSLTTDFCVPFRGERDTQPDIQAIFDAGYEYVYAGKRVTVIGDTLTLNSDTKFFGASPAWHRMLTDPNWKTDGTPEYMLTTVADAEGTGQLKGIKFYRYGRNGEDQTSLRTLNPEKLHAHIDWKLGGKSQISWTRIRAGYSAANKNFGTYLPIESVRFEGPTAGGTIFAFTDIDKGESGCKLTGGCADDDYLPYVVRNNGQPITHYGPNDEHKQNRKEFHRVLESATNYQSFGNKVECTMGLVRISDSDNISVGSHGVGCEPFTAEQIPATVKVEDSTNIRLSSLMPHDWSVDLDSDNLHIFKNGVKTVEFGHGDGVGLYLEGSFDNTAFAHGNDCDTSTLWGNGELIHPETFCPSLAGGGTTPPPTAQCSDGIDNDSDGLTDFPADPGCGSADDDNETDAAAKQCADGIDNDGDGLIDHPNDPGCTGAGDDNEFNASTGANLLPEPGFETSANWNVANNHVINSTNPQTGTFALQATSTGAQTSSTTFSDLVTLEQGKEYRVKASVAAQDLVSVAGETPILTVQQRTSGNDNVELAPGSNITEGYRWAPYPSQTYEYQDTGMEQTFQLADDADAVRVGVRTWFGQTSGTTWWDNFSLVEVDRSYRGAEVEVLTAEAATNLSGIALHTTINNYTGAGYLDVEEDNGTAEWTVSSTGTFLPVVRYSREGPNTKMWISVNGETVLPVSRPVPTGRRGIYATFDLTEITVTAGDTVSIRVQKAGTGEPSQAMIDKITLHQVN